MDIETLRQERAQNTHDVYNNKIPKRVPINVGLSFTAIADYGKVDRKAAYWDPTLLHPAINELCQIIPTDSGIGGSSVYTPVSSQPLDALNRSMSSTGFMQHPNTMCMEPDEYDELIEDPYAFLLDKAVPRVYKALDTEVNPGRHVFALYQEQMMRQTVTAKEMPGMAEIRQKYGYPAARSRGGSGRVPMDYLADQLRSFDGICLDVRRRRDKVIAAMEALYPLIYKMGLHPGYPDKIDRDGMTSFQLHMGSYLRLKDFEEIWLPTWKRLLTDYASLGMRCAAFLEHEWTEPLLEHINELPVGSSFSFESTSAKLIKEKLGKRHVLSGGFPLEALLLCTKDEVIDKTKAWLDIMAPGGQYIFGFDKSVLALEDIKLENLIACAETVRDYGVYDNAGESTGVIFNKEDYKHSEPAIFKSKYYMTFEQFQAKYPETTDNAASTFVAAENNMLRLIFAMTM